jgi:predicted MFS family arabinose efflux permease
MSNATPAAEPTAAYRGWVLFMLVVVYTFNFLDRQIMGILSIPIQEELGFSDTQLGLMRGVSFALFYATLGVPIALLADRMNRVKIMTAALVVWSAFTAVCGLATNFWQMFAARLMVGVGEAGGVAPAYSIVADYHPPQQRATALAIYSFGIPIGSAIGIFFGAVIATLIDWRAAFIIIGIAGVALAPIFWLTVREPQRGRFDPPGSKTTPAPLRAVLSTLVNKPSFWLLSVGAASSSMMGYGLFAWLPAYFVRSHGEGLAEALAWLPSFMHLPNASPLLYAGYFYGTIVLIGGVLGIGLGGVLADKLGKVKRSAYAIIPAVAFLIAAPCFAFGLMSNNLLLQWFVFLLPTALSLAWLGPVLAAFQGIVPPNMRATASAVFLLINNLIGIGLGDFLIGLMSEQLRAAYGDESLRYSILAGTVFYIVAAVLLLLASTRLAKDWEGEPAK